MPSTLDTFSDFFRQQKEVYGSTIFFDEPTLSMEKISMAKRQKEITAPIRGSELDISTSEQIKTSNTVPPAWASLRILADLNQAICNCQNCPLGATRNKFVFGVGNPHADIMVIGEAPGADEDAQGEPFVGRAGQLLTKILEAIGFSRSEVFIANILKCRPPQNRRPTAAEVEQCEPYLLKQIELIKPRFILSLGLTATSTLLRREVKMADIRGKVLDYHGTPMIATYHPAALLRNPEWKKPTWEDVQLLRKLYDASKATDGKQS